MKVREHRKRRNRRQTAAPIGAEAPLMIDFNQACTPRNAVATAALMEEAAPLWIEEPTSPGDLAGYRLVSNHTSARP
ncbi:hypothetical protein KXR53_26850 [Inquilinus limosus]|uniref:enolase C-terminal domain-like protein n=1 Tax=Inquilinus limosus TaxID=171674 RepID=UPI003F1673D6